MEARLQQLYAASFGLPPAAAPHNITSIMEHHHHYAAAGGGSGSDAFWASLNEASLFANDFLLQLPPNRQQQQSPGGGSSSALGAETSFFHATRAHDASAGDAEDFSFALSGIVDDEEDTTTSTNEDENNEKKSTAATGGGQEPRVPVAHFLTEIMSLSSSVANSSFSSLLARRVQLLRRIQEGCARQRLLQQSNSKNRALVQVPAPPPQPTAVHTRCVCVCVSVLTAK
jgi:hypothetical protein